MARQTLVLEELCVHRFRGVQRAQERICLPESGLFAPGLNLIYGPNGSGKTTVALALQHLVWPEHAPPPQAHVTGRVAVGDARWEVDVDAGQVRRTGVPPAGLPPIPSAETRGRYLLALHELLQAEDSDLAGLVQREVNGGFDLASAREALGFMRRTPSANLGEARAYRDARARVRELQDRQRALQSQAEELAGLRAKAVAAHAARARVALLQGVLEWRQCQAALAAAEEQLGRFDPALANLRGTDLDTLERLTAEIAAKERAAAGLETDCEALRAANEVSIFGEDPAGVGERLSELRTLQAQLEQLEADEQRLSRDRAAAAAALTTARTAMGAAIRDEQLATLTDCGLADVTDLAHAAEEYRGRRQAFAVLRSWLDDPEPDIEERIRRLQRGLELLRAWLRAGTGDGVPFREAAAVTVLALALAILLGVLQHPAWLILLAPAAWLGFRLWQRLGSGPAPTRRVDYESLDLPMPDEWLVAAVVRRCETLSADLARCQLQRRQREFWQALEPERQELEETGRRLAARRAELQQALGVAPDLDEARLYLLVRSLSVWQEARVRLAEADGRLAELRALQDSKLANFNERKVPSATAEPCADSAAALAAVKTAEKRWQEFVENRERLAAAGRRQRELRAELKDLHARANALLQPFADASNPGAAAAAARLRRLAPDLDAYTAARHNVRDLQRDGEQLEGKLNELPGFTRALLELDSTAAAEQCRQAEEQAQQAQMLDQRIVEIETRVDTARRGRELEAALAAEADAGAVLRAVRERAAAAAVGELLTRTIQGRSQQRASAVLTAARRLFGAITQHRYELQLGTESGPAFTARDTATGTLRNLDTLSSGTRVQLLLAVRVAFVELQERSGPRLPLILDEILGNSDDARAAAIITAIRTLTAAGRQVFYFTAQWDEIGKWRAALADGDTGNWRELRLPVQARQEQSFHLPIDRPEPATIPAPDGLSHADYGERLAVPAFDPLLPDPGRLHLWYVIWDTNALQALLQHGYQTWGQLQSLAADADERVLDQLGISRDPLLLAKAGARARILTQLMKLWRVGRGDPVDRGVLLESGAVSNRFLGAATACARSVDGEADRFLEALDSGEIKGFRRKKLAELREFLQQRGCLDPRPRLPANEIRARIDAAAAADIERGLITAAGLRELLDSTTAR